jgi:hypothetical protein
MRLLNEKECLLLQANIICLLLFAIAAVAITQHSAWFQ